MKIMKIIDKIVIAAIGFFVVATIVINLYRKSFYGRWWRLGEINREACQADIARLDALYKDPKVSLITLRFPGTKRPHQTYILRHYDSRYEKDIALVRSACPEFEKQWADLLETLLIRFEKAPEGYDINGQLFI